MKLFSKEVNLKLFKQYPKGGDLQNQVVVTKIFNPYGAGRWYLINSDPDDPDYIWAIVQMGSIVEVGSVSRKQLESIRIKPFNLPLERDLYFDPVNASELFKGLSEGKFYKAGGWTEGGENKAMLLNQAEGFEHHAEELEKAVKASDHVPAWVVAKSERASTDLSDITHYLDGENEQKREMVEGEEEEEYADGGVVKWEEAEYGDNALVVSENKMGVIIKPYGRKFHLKFVDGTEKTYDASELKFFKDMDDFDMGGKMAEGGETKNKNYSTWAFWKEEYENYIKELKEKIKADYDDDEVSFLTKQQEYELETYEDKLEKHLEQGKEKGWYGKGGYMAEGGDTKEARFIIKSGNKGKLNEVLNQPSWQLQPFQLREVFENEKMNGKSVFLFVNDELYEQYVQESDEDYYGEAGYMAEGGEVKVGDKVKSKSGVEGEVYESTGMFFKLKDKYGNKNPKLFSVRDFKPSEIKSMAEGGATEKKYFMTVYFEQKQLSGGYGINRKSITVSAKNETEAKSKAKKLVKENFRSGLPIKNMRVLEDTIKVEETKYAHSGMMEGGGETDKKITFKRGDYFIVLKDMGKLKRFRIWKIDGNSVTINYSRYDGTDVYDSNETKSNLKYLLENGYIKKVNKTTYWNRKYENYAEGGKVKFKDKVASIKASLLKRKKVPKAVQKDYGKTFSPAEAEDSAKRIAGAMTAKERLQARLKKRKK